MAILAPSILSANLSNLGKQIRLVEMSGADWIHCDVMDGHFVPNITFGPIIVKAANEVTKLPLDVHLMIENPDEFIEGFVEAGADHILVHYEAVVHLNRTINFIKNFGVKAGVVINPSTPVSSIRDVAEYIDQLLVMSVNPGFGGQSFIPNSVRRIREAVAIRKEMNANFLIEVDGGVDTKNIDQILKAGCDVFVIGSSIFNSSNIAAATVEFKNVLNS
jgi:ribulose-phosphate 3-epimerase